MQIPFWGKFFRNQGDFEMDKKQEIASSNLGMEKEVEALLQECQALRDEAVLHLEAQYQLANVALVLFGGLVTAITLLFIADSQVLHLTTLNLDFFLLLLILVTSALFSSLFHASLSHQHDLGLIGVYIYHVTRVRLRELLGIEKDSQFFSWDRFHQQQLISGGKVRGLVAAIFVSAHFIVEVMLAVLMLVVASWIYVANFSLFAGNIIWDLIVGGLIIFDALYLLVAIPVSREDLSIFEQIPKEGS